MSDPAIIRVYLDKRSKRYNLKRAEEMLNKAREKYYGKRFLKRTGVNVFLMEGTVHFQRHYGDLWKKMLRHKGGEKCVK